MQVTQSDPDCQRVGVEEKFIKFKSSPNFKNMKKFLKSKIDSSPSSPPATPFSGRTVQPPLPTQPPPPESPADIQLDSEGLRNTQDNQTSSVDTDTSSETSKKTIKKICRDFLRGTCTRPSCRYAHVFDKSQLPALYTFCKNYQNSVCKYPNCRFVHATIFEQENFYRTSILPPHALAHCKRPATVLPPPPPPPPEVQLPLPTKYTNPPPMIPNTKNQMPVNSSKQHISSTIVNQSVNDINIHSDLSSASYQFDAESDDALDTNPKCDTCELKKMRYIFNKNKFDAQRLQVEKMVGKIKIIDKKNEELFTLIHMILEENLNKKV